MTTYEEHDDDLANWPTAPKTIDAIRAIVDDRACKVIDGVLVDTWTATAILTVYEACDEEKRAVLMDLSIERMGRFAWRVVK